MYSMYYNYFYIFSNYFRNKRTTYRLSINFQSSVKISHTKFDLTLDKYV